MKFILFSLLFTLLGQEAWAKGEKNDSFTNFQVLLGNGYKLGDQKRTIFTFEHASSWARGENFFFFDVTEPNEEGTGVYGEYSPSFALTKDLSLAATFEMGSGVRNKLYGLMWKPKVPHMTYFKVFPLLRDNPSQRGVTYQVTLAWHSFFSIFQQTFVFTGFADFAGHEGSLKSNQLIVPQLLWNANIESEAPSPLYFGVEYQYWKNKYGVEGVTESVPQLMMKWYF